MTLRILGALVGDVAHQPSARAKYSGLFAALAQHAKVTLYDATLRGWRRGLNAARVFHPQWARWRQQFYHNVPAFSARSQQFARHLPRLLPADVILQEGVLFDASDLGVPVVIYTDYTDRLLQRQARVGRLYLSPREHEQWIMREARAYERAAHVCTRSALARQSLIDDYGLPPERVTAIGGGVNFDPLPAEPERAAHSAPTALFIGKDFYRKGGDLLLCAFARVREQLPEARLVMLTGEAIPEDLPRAGVKIVAPTWERAAIAQLYAQADVFVLPSRLETWGDVLLEAMAFGVPCVGVTGQAMEDIILPERTGLIAPPENESALAEALLRLLKDVNWRQALGRAARQRVEAHFTWAQVAARLMPILRAASPPAASALRL